MEVLAALVLIGLAGYILTKGLQDIGFDSSDLLPSAPSYSWEIQQVAKAIAYAEGFYVQGSAPQRAHNPGALKVPGWKGATTGTEGISVFASDAEGWQALYRQLALIVSGASGIYSLNMSIGDMAKRWTATDQSAWANNVSSELGVSTSTRLTEVLV